MAGEQIAIEASKAIVIITKGHLHNMQVNITIGTITIDEDR